MRHLVLAAALALVAACGDTTSPTTAPRLVELGTADGRTDLRRARESLITAGNEVSAEIGRVGVAAGLVRLALVVGAARRRMQNVER